MSPEVEEDRIRERARPQYLNQEGNRVRGRRGPPKNRFAQEEEGADPIFWFDSMAERASVGGRAFLGPDCRTKLMRVWLNAVWRDEGWRGRPPPR